MISFESRGSTDKTEAFLKKMVRGDVFDILDRYGQEGVSILSNATPVDSALTANSWYYEIVKHRGTYSIVWRNSHVVDGFPVAIMLSYGHGTRTGGYVTGRDYINPAMRPLFDRIANDVWKAVTSL